MLTLIRVVRQRFQHWEPAARIAFIVAVIILIVLIAFAFSVAPEQRAGALGSVALAFIVLQGIFMWANRGMISDYTRAQRAYMAGDFKAALELLTQSLEVVKGRKATDTLTLLGNVHRQLGDIERSKEMLRAAVQTAPEYYFSLYGFGRTLLAEGNYAEAALFIKRALEAGAPAPVNVDYAEALYRDGAAAEAVLTALTAGESAAQAEPHRALLVAYIRHQLGDGPAPDAGLVAAGIAFWQASAERFAHTPYGAALQADVIRMQSYV
jgi:tetratricopeptide (TPR) repeat protein